jgi:hypothetical protein
MCAAFYFQDFPQKYNNKCEVPAEDHGIQIMGGADVVTEATWTQVVYKGVINLTVK